jgi:hypothetical protein
MVSLGFLVKQITATNEHHVPSDERVLEYRVVSFIGFWFGHNLSGVPVDWTATVATHIKLVLNAKQLVMDGRYGIDADSLATKTVDMYSDHFYPMNVTKLQVGAQEVTQVKSK